MEDKDVSHHMQTKQIVLSETELYSKLIREKGLMRSSL